MTAVAVVDYGMGNLRSVTRAFESLHAEVTVTSKARDLEAADRIVLPGVGAFGEGMRNLRQLELIECLDAEVRGRGKPFLGICLGMELLAMDGHEHGHHAGLGWIDASAVALTPGPALKTIHIGWNDVRAVRASALLHALGPSPTFYFVHGYHLACRDRGVVTAVTEYGGEVVAAVERGNIAGVQFHPEKSQETGLALLRAFLRWTPERPGC
jgi:glutamine amidotransferase